LSDVTSILEKKLLNFRYRLSVDEATLLYDKCDLNDLMYTSLEVRKLINPDNKITYLVDRNINYTINCQFCSFYRPPGHKDAYTQSYEEISTRISELEKIGGTRILMQGGVNPELSLDWYLDLIKYLRENHPSIALDCFSPIEIEGIAEVCNLSTLNVLKKLAKAGMHGLPGGGAEILVDAIRNDISPKKGSGSNWLKVMEEAQNLGLTTSATNVFGFGETNLDRVMHMEQIRMLQDKAIQNEKSGFTSFIAWPVQLENNSFGRRNRGANRIELGATAQEYLRHIAVSRLFFDNIDHIQASWPTMGLGVAQLAMLAGADDAGSTMMEENVVSASGTKKTEALEGEIQNSIIRAGFTPQKRDSDYNFLSTTVVTTMNSYSPIPQQF
jgi:cyclic dehypoxanthinyl futalosine synthase